MAGKYPGAMAKNPAKQTHKGNQFDGYARGAPSRTNQDEDGFPTQLVQQSCLHHAVADEMSRSSDVDSTRRDIAKDGTTRTDHGALANAYTGSDEDVRGETRFRLDHDPFCI